ncbi:hypothetical protein D050_3812B, partial [Vibrio parahaemolyticus VPCR-2009]
RYK